MLEEETPIKDCLFSSAVTLDDFKLDDLDIYVKEEPVDDGSQWREQHDYLGSSSGSPSSSLSSPDMKDQLGVDLAFCVPFPNNNPFLHSPASSSGSPFGTMFPNGVVHCGVAQQNSPLPPVSHFSQGQNGHQIDPSGCLASNIFGSDASMFEEDRSPSPPTSDRSSPMDNIPSMLNMVYDAIPDTFGGVMPNGMVPGLTMAQQQLKSRSKMHEMAVKQRLITDQDPRSQGMVQLSAEERRTLQQEGYPVPTRLPLTKAEEEALKIVRRKIKNKLSAQESRRKRKEYMDTLEQRCQCYYNENSQLKGRMRQLEMNNKQLMAQVKKLQDMMGVSE